MTESWDDHAANWDQDERVRRYADQAFLSLTRHVDLLGDEWKGKRVLDFGCGTGLLTEKLAPLVREVVAVDTSPNMIEALRRKEIGNVTAICADLEDHGVRSSAPWFSAFDLIVASSVCGFLPNYELTIRLLSQALNATGLLVQWDWLSSGNDDFGMTADSVSNAFSRAGLECIHLDRAFAISFDGEEMPVLMGIASVA